ncbi:hypothetical protein [Sphingomonas sp. dw_22]|nr:hypothetical protein [Sphingomonas sp. dw_22]
MAIVARFTPVKDEATLDLSDCARNQSKQIRLFDSLDRLVDT